MQLGLGSVQLGLGSVQPGLGELAARTIGQRTAF